MTNKKEVYLVEGMSCQKCERTIQRVVSNLHGVRSAEVSLSEATVAVEYDSEQVTVGEIKTAVNNLGYKITGERPAHGQRESSGEGIP